MSTPSAPAPFTPKWYDSTFVVIVLILLFFPVGVFALIKNRRLSGAGKFMLGGAVMFLMAVTAGAMAVGGWYLLKKNPSALQAWKDKLISPSTPTQTTTTPKREPEKIVSTDLPAETVPLPPAPTQSVTITPPQPIAPAQKISTSPIPPNIPPVPIETAQDDDVRAKTAIDADAIAKANAANAPRELEKFSAETKSDADLLAILKQKQAGEYMRAIDALTAANDPAHHAALLEARFKQHLVNTYKSEAFDTAKFSAFFTPEFVRDYNADVARFREEVRKSIATLENSESRVREFQDRVMQKIDDANQRLAAAGKPKLDLDMAGNVTDAQIQGMKTRFATLPERPLTINDLRQYVGMKAVNAPNIASNPRPPVTPANPFSPATPSTPIQPPLRPVVPPLPADAITSADMNGGWRRGDGKVSWVIEEGGQMASVGAGRKSPGTWTYDPATSTLAVTLNTIKYTFKVTRAKDQLSMEGGAGGAVPLRFSKVSKY